MLHSLLVMIVKGFHSSELSENRRQNKELLELFLGQCMDFCQLFDFSGKDVQLFSLQELFVLLLLRHQAGGHHCHASGQEEEFINIEEKQAEYLKTGPNLPLKHILLHLWSSHQRNLFCCIHREANLDSK